jgi:hypothetical protein
VPDSFNVGLHTRLLMAALDRSNGPVTITEGKPGWFIFRSESSLPGFGDIKAHIPTIDPAALPTVKPDAACAILDDRFKVALAIVAPLATPKAAKIAAASLLLIPGGIVGTNLNVMAEAYHGIDLPTGLILPKEFAAAVLKVNEPLTGFGCSETSITMHYASGAWMKTQLYVNGWPNPNKMWSTLNNAKAWEIPEYFFDAVQAIKPHCHDGIVHLLRDRVSSSNHPELEGASVACEGLPDALLGFKLRDLELIAPYAEYFHLMSPTAFFTGDNVRGAISCL